EAVAQDPIIGQGNCGAARTVIGLVDARGADSQRAGGDIGSGAGRGVGGIVGRIGAGDRDAADRDSLAGADVLVSETGAGVAGSEAVAGQAVVRERDGGAGGAVIDFVDRASRDAQGAGGDIGVGAGGGRSQLIVAGIGAAQAQAADRDGFVGADRFAGKAGGAAAEADVVAAQHAVKGAGGDGGIGGAIIDLVVGADQGSEGGDGDIGGSAGGDVGGVVGRIGASEDDAADADRFGSADVRVGETGAGVAGREAVAGHAVIGQGDGGGRRAIIELVHACGAHDQRPRGDVGGRAGGGIGGVVGDIGAAEGDAADGDGLGRADVLVGETGAGVAGGEAVACHAVIRKSDRD